MVAAPAELSASVSPEVTEEMVGAVLSETVTGMLSESGVILPAASVAPDDHVEWNTPHRSSSPTPRIHTNRLAA